MKKRALLGIAAVAVASFGGGFYLYREAYRHKRVWVTYSEKYDDKHDADNKLFAEERLAWRISWDKSCMVALTHDRQRADYIVSISVIRLPTNGPPGIFGEASLSIAKRNGDVVLVESFYQDRNSAEDIAQQPITKTWDVLCQK